MLRLIASWCLLGFIVILLIPKCKFTTTNKVLALLILFASGPICWLLFIVSFVRKDDPWGEK
jgi:TctA family transporter